MKAKPGPALPLTRAHGWKMSEMNEKRVLRTRDLWTSMVLFGVSLFFLFKTAEIPFFDTKSAGVESAQWYNSAALVPFGIFGALLVLSVVLFAVAVRDGALQWAVSAAGLGADRNELCRLACVALVLFFYVFGLVPRVDFIISSALLITALTWGFHSGSRHAMLAATASISLPALYAMIAHFEPAEWGAPHDDDWLALICFLAVTLYMLFHNLRDGALDRVVKLTPVIAILCPLLLVLAMAFGFRQNVPNRTGLLFKHIEYHYYVTVKPFLVGR